MTGRQVEEVVARLAREGIRVTASLRGEGVRVRVVSTAWSQPHTWLRLFMEFGATGLAVTID